MDYFKQIFFELEENTIYQPSIITSGLLKKYPDLGNEIVLPIDMSDNNTPIFIFTQNPFFNVQGNFNNIVITISESYNKDFVNIINSIFELLKNNSINVVGLALIIQEQMNKYDTELFKKMHFINFDTIKNDQIQFSMVREIDINKKKTRCLEGYSTLDNDLTLHFEFNMKRVDFRILDWDYINKFIFETINYKEARTKCLLDY